MASQTSTARDFALNLTTMELRLDANGDWPLVRDLDAIAQDAHTKLGLIKGEWFLDLTVGLDLFGTILVKTPALGLLRSEVSRVLLTVKGITSVSSVEVVLDRVTRRARVSWSALADAGELRNQTTEVLL